MKISRRTFFYGAGASAAAAAAGLGGYAFVSSTPFGHLPSGADLAAVERSPHYADGAFRNSLPTSVETGGGKLNTLWKWLTADKRHAEPPKPLPYVKTDLHALSPAEDLVVWLGHSSFYLHLGGRRILIDPVLSDHASPLPFVTRAFAGSMVYAPADFPDIDLILLSHDHWDHMDYPTLTALRPRTAALVCPLGCGSHLRYWGFEPSRVREGDWGDSFSLGGIRVHVTESRHFSGRSLTRNKTLWGGFALEGPARRIYYSGDGGYGPHFADIGRRFGSFDLALLECGQYDENWRSIHMHPSETAQACDDLHAAVLLPAHAGKFCISRHAWNDPYRQISAESRGRAWKLATPKPGSPLMLNGMKNVSFEPWWEKV